MSLLPPNATPFERAMEQALAVPALPVPLRALWNASTCPAALLPWLAWSFSVDNWSPDWPEVVRRNVTAGAIRVAARKGTVAAVRQAIAAFGVTMSLREWWQMEPPGDPGSFQVVLALADIDGAAPTPAFVESVVAEIDRTKPLSRPFTFTQALRAAAAVGLIAVARPVVMARLNARAPAA